MWRLAFSISGDSFKRERQPSVQAEGPMVEIYFSLREIWTGVRVDILSAI